MNILFRIAKALDVPPGAALPARRSHIRRAAFRNRPAPVRKAAAAAQYGAYFMNATLS